MDFDFTQQPGEKKFFESDQYNTKKPLVTIITPFFNAGKLFSQTFNCVVNQTFPWFEWIIVDDGSTEESDLQLLSEYEKKDQRIKCYHKNNGGISSARNFAIEHSNTNLIVPLDADDLISPTYIEINYWALYFNPAASWSYTDSVGFGQQEYLWKKPFSSEVMKVNNILTCTAMIRKDTFSQVGHYSEVSKHFNEDWHAWLKLIAEQKYPVHINGYHFWYRRSNTGVLTHVNKEKKVRKKTHKIIQTAEKRIKSEVKAIEFPLVSKINQYIPPKRSNWKDKLKRNNDYRMLMILPWLEMGGADSFNLSFVQYALKQSFDVGIVTTVFSDNSWKQRFELYLADIFELPNFLEVKDYAEFISYYIISRNVNIIFISNSYYGYYLIPWLHKEFPGLAIVDYVHMEEWYWRNGGYARNSGVFGNFIDKTFVCNASTKKVLSDYFNRKSESIVVSYIGVDNNVYDVNNVDSGLIKNELNLDKRKVILFPCRLEYQKRPHLMLQIVLKIKAYFNDIAVLVIGDGPLIKDLEIKVRELNLQDNVYLLGRKLDLRPYYKDSDLTLICSLKEGLSLTSYESCAMGVPVISADVGGQSELIDQSVGAIIPLRQEETDYNTTEYDLEEVNDYVNEILKVLNDTEYRKELSKNCRERIIEKFTISNTMANLILMIKDIVDKYCKKQSDLSQYFSYEDLVDDYLTLYCEIENYVNSYNYGIDRNDKSELMRIVNSRLGQRILKLAFKLKLNKLFK